MKVSTRSRYGLRLAVYLAEHYGKGPVILKDVAAEEDISEKYLGQIVIILRGAGLVNSLRGAKGGYELAYKPSELSLDRIVLPLEGGTLNVDCLEGKKCSNLQNCLTMAFWKELDDMIISKLKSTTLQDLVDRKKRLNKNLNYEI